MRGRLLWLICSTGVVALSGNLHAAETEAGPAAQAYVAPRTEYGQPDLQGAWGTVFYTMLERPEGVPLELPPEAAAGFAQNVYSIGLSGNTDPDVDRFGTPTLTRVNGQYRTSVIVYPENGLLPYNERGARESNYPYFKGEMDFDHPEQRPGVERCLESWGHPPIRAFAYHLIHGIVQTADLFVIISEDMAGLRVIHLDEHTRPDAIRDFSGHSNGHWEGETLVVETTHLRGDIPARASLGRPMLISGEARITERFTRVSEGELLYQYTVDDPYYYTEPWRGEFTLLREADDHIYEYACHEGNYSMVGALRGERYKEMQEREQAEN